MNRTSRHEISASKAVGYVKLRLSAERSSKVDFGSKTNTDIDEVIAHMRSRLRRLAPQRDSSNFRRSLNN